jgi:hypothetical protein
MYDERLFFSISGDQHWTIVLILYSSCYYLLMEE